MIALIKAAIATALCFVIAVGEVSGQENRSWVMAQLPRAPEGLTVDSEGMYYASLHFTGEVVRITPDGSYEHVAWVPSQSQSGEGVLVGIEIESERTLIAAYKGTSRYDTTDSIFNPFHPSCRDATETTSGIYRVYLDTGQVEALATRADGWPFCFPDDVAIGTDGSLYLADLTYSGIWKLSPDGKKVSLWSSHPLLNWGPEPFRNAPIGVNVIAFSPDKSVLYAATDGNPLILSFPLLENGSAGEPRLLPETSVLSMESTLLQTARFTSRKSYAMKYGPTVRMDGHEDSLPTPFPHRFKAMPVLPCGTTSCVRPI